MKKTKSMKAILSIAFLLMSINVIFTHQVGGDPHGIVLISSNPILAKMSHNIFTSDVMNSGFIVQTDSLYGSISIYWYIGSVVTMMLYGYIIGAIIDVIRKRKVEKNSTVNDM